jgi:hypothetical protein
MGVAARRLLRSGDEDMAGVLTWRDLQPLWRQMHRHPA